MLCIALGGKFFGSRREIMGASYVKARYAVPTRVATVALTETSIVVSSAYERHATDVPDVQPTVLQLVTPI
jgi:hypothetical protein